MHTAAAYIRVSTDDQTEYSPDAQLRAIKAYCEKNDYFLDPKYIFIDEGKSGRKAEKRPAFMRMIGAAKTKPAPFEAILCHKFDRFARNREDSVVYKSLLHKECGVKVISITESIENDKIGLIMESMLEAMAEYYSINLGEEVKKGMTEKARRGEPCSVAPFGYKMSAKKLIPDDHEAPVVREIFRDFVNGKSYFGIAKECNASGVRSHRGGLFENRTIEYMIHNPVYAGYIRWTPTGKIRRNFSNPESLIVKGRHTPIIDMATFEAAQKRAKEIKALYKPYQKPVYHHSHWLVGLLRCAYCGCSLVNSNGYFICSGYVHGKCAHRGGTKLEDMERRVLNAVKHDLMNPDFIQISQVADNGTNPKIDSAIADLSLRLSRCKAAYERGIDSMEEYAACKTRLNSEIKKLQSMRSTPDIKGCTRSVVLDMRRLLNEFDDRAAAARKFIQSIAWDKDAQSLAITYFRR